MARIDRGWDADPIEQGERAKGGSLRAAAHAFERTFGRCRAFPSENGHETFVVKVTGPTEEPRARRWWEPRRPEYPLEVLAYRTRDGAVTGVLFVSVDGADRPTFPDTGIEGQPFAGNWGDEISEETRLHLLNSVLWELTHGRPTTEIPEVYGHQTAASDS